MIGLKIYDIPKSYFVVNSSLEVKNVVNTTYCLHNVQLQSAKAILFDKSREFYNNKKCHDFLSRIVIQ